MLVAVGAPPTLVEQSRPMQALEGIDHARRCFALAAGYGGRSHTVDAMPDLLVGGLDLHGDPLVHLAVESIKDGCCSRTSTRMSPPVRQRVPRARDG